MSAQSICEAMDTGLNAINCDSAGFSGKSMRRGGLSVAWSGGVPEDLRRMQSGHESECNRRYEVATSPDMLYEFSKAFGL